MSSLSFIKHLQGLPPFDGSIKPLSEINGYSTKKGAGVMKLIEGFQGAAFGLTDGVICIIGLIIGVAVATSNINLILIAAIAGGLADALGNAIGFYLSELTERGSQIHARDEHGITTVVHSLREVFLSGALSFLATAFVLFVLLAPFFFLDINSSVICSFGIAAVILFSLGAYVGKLSNESPMRKGMVYLVLGILGAAFSYLVGYGLHIWL